MDRMAAADASFGDTRKWPVSFAGRAPELLAGGAFVAALLAACVLLSERRLPWADEIITLRILALPTWTQMWGAVADPIGHMPFYFAAARLWSALFGGDVLSLRLFSTLGFVAGFLVVWAGCRPLVSTRSLALTLGCMAALSPVLLDQMVQVRFYGLFFLMVACAFYTFVRTERVSRPRAILVFADALIHALLVLTHIFGVVFSAMIFAARLWLALATGTWRPRLLAAQLVAMSALLPWLPTLQAQRALAEPHYIHPVPTLYDFERLAGVDLHAFGLTATIVLVLAAAAAALRPAGSTAGRPTAPMGAGAAPELAFAAAVATVPFLIFIISKVGTPVLVARYVMPALIGWTIVSALALEQLVEKPLRNAAPTILRNIVDALVVALTAALWLSIPLAAARSPQQYGYGAIDEKYADYGLPIVVENDVAYMARAWNGPRPELYYFLLDWDAAMVPGNEPNATVGFKLQANSKLHFPALNIVPFERFLDATPRFLVADSPSNLWAERRLLDNPAYRVTRLGPITGSSFNETMLLVERLAATANGANR